jgi:cell division protein FtsI/penicillin-binding protein 2
MPLTFATKPRRRFFRWRTLLIVLVVGALAAGAFVIFKPDDGPPPLPASEVDGFLKAWTRGDATGMAAQLDQAPTDLEKTAMSLVRAEPGGKATYTRTGLVRTDTGSQATYHARVDVGGVGSLEWDGKITAVRVKNADNKEVWKLEWHPDVLYPGLQPGERLGVQRKWPTRASILNADGSLLAGAQQVVTIGVEPDRVKDSLPVIKQTMQRLLGTDPAAIDAALHTPGIQPNYFVAITNVPDDSHYEKVLRPQLAPLPGVFFRRSNAVLAGAGGATAQLVGTVGEVTADRLKELSAPYRVGDQAGLSGLQAAYERRLAGTPSVDIGVVEKNKFRTLRHFAGHRGANVKLTLDARMQQAGESALAGVAQPAALVAIDVPSGQLRAIVSKPDGGFNRAIAGSYPPGSTFKIVTSAALLANGSTGTTPAPCPATITVYGRTFKNFEGEAAGALDLANAFKISCNNAFIGLADKLPPNTLRDTAGLFGFNAKWSLPVESAEGSFPPPIDRAELAASAIGQGRVLASPMQMASVAAAVASGRWRAPALVSQPKPSSPKVKALDPRVLNELRAFMASVPQQGGTAAGAGLPPGTLGKTGTAEFGPGNPPNTHAWFVGYRGNVAFAVVVEGGGVGGRVAAPLAARFLNALG